MKAYGSRLLFTIPAMAQVCASKTLRVITKPQVHFEKSLLKSDSGSPGPPTKESSLRSWSSTVSGALRGCLRVGNGASATRRPVGELEVQSRNLEGLWLTICRGSWAVPWPMHNRRWGYRPKSCKRVVVSARPSDVH